MTAVTRDGGPPLRAHDGVEGQAVQQGVEAAGLQGHVEAIGCQAGVDQQRDRGGAGTVELVVDPLVDGPLLGVDQGAAGEGEPDLALGAPLVVQRHQLVQELLGQLPGVDSVRPDGRPGGSMRSPSSPATSCACCGSPTTWRPGWRSSSA